MTTGDLPPNLAALAERFRQQRAEAELRAAELEAKATAENLIALIQGLQALCGGAGVPELASMLDTEHAAYKIHADDFGPHASTATLPLAVPGLPSGSLWVNMRCEYCIDDGKDVPRWCERDDPDMGRIPWVCYRDGGRTTRAFDSLGEALAWLLASDEEADNW